MTEDIDLPDICDDCEYTYPDCNCDPEECMRERIEDCYEGIRDVD